MSKNFQNNSLNKQYSSNVGNKIFYFFYYLIIIGIIIFIFSFVAFYLMGFSKEGGLLLFPLFFFFLSPVLSLITAFVVYRDAKKLQRLGAEVESPILWGFLTLFLLPICLPLYLSFRKVDFKKQVKDKNSI